MEIEPDTPVAHALTAARKAYADKNVSAMDRAYRQAVSAAPDDEIRTELAIEHVSRLHTLRRTSIALQRCTAYLRAVDGQHPVFRLLKAEILGTAGDHLGALAEISGLDVDSLEVDHQARLLRVEGLAAAYKGDLHTADLKLAAATGLFHQAGNADGVAEITRDRRNHGVAHGEAEAIYEALTDPLRTFEDYLARVTAHKRELRYDEALRVLRTAIGNGVDPALRFMALRELVILLRLTRQDKEAAGVKPLLAEAALQAADPTAAQAEIAELFPGNTGKPTRFESRIDRAMLMIHQGQLGDAEEELVRLRDDAHEDKQAALWHITAGWLELTRNARNAPDDPLRQAEAHFAAAVGRADTMALAEIRAFALLLLGRAKEKAGRPDEAETAWATAQRIEEHIAGQQRDDHIRVRMLQAVPEVPDMRIEIAAEIGAIPSIAVALEAARGATIVGLVRELPKLTDVDSTTRWLDTVRTHIPKDRLIWMMHATPDAVHHVLVGQDILRYYTVPQDRADIAVAVDGLKSFWDPKFLDFAVEAGDFVASLADIARKVGVSVVFDDVPARITRISIMAGGVLSDIPFAGLPLADNRIVQRFALSDLPCLSALRPLTNRARRQRGDRRLLVSPPDSLTKTKPTERDLVNEKATVDNLRAAVAGRRYRRVRIDSHGKYDSALPWLQLADRLHPNQLADMDLRRTGTLTLGACESGMGTIVGRDERAGFVRAAINAGTAAVVAARWIAADTVAAEVLDRFDRYIRYLPRDIALQRAQLAVCDQDPARWACWTLYGDTGFQTKAGAVRRWWRGRHDD